jgi:hypothetical protein
MDRVKCTITFFYDPESYLFHELDFDERPSDEEILRRCKEMMLIDVTDQTEPLTIEAIHAEFIEGSNQDG